MIRAFEDILQQNETTKSIQLLEVSTERNLYAFLNESNKLSKKDCQRKIDEIIEGSSLHRSADQVHSFVKVGVVNLKWLRANCLTFLDFVPTLRHTKNKAILQTKFVETLLF